MAGEQKPDEQQSDTPQMVTSDKDGVWKMDVDTFVPKPDGYVTVGGVDYPIFSFLDIPIADSLKVARLGEDIKSVETYDDRLERSIEQVMLLNAPGTPRLTREHFKNASPRQVITLTVLASSIAKVPLKAAGPEDSPSGSPSPSPESADSTGGGERSSSA